MFELDVHACGPIKSFKRTHHACKQTARIRVCRIRGSRLRCLTLLQGIELPALEDGCANKKLLVRPITIGDRFTPTSHTSSQIKADEKTKLFLAAYSAQKMKIDVSLNLSLSYHCRIPTTCMETGGQWLKAHVQDKANNHSERCSVNYKIEISCAVTVLHVHRTTVLIKR